MSGEKAVVLLSGGLDSATCLAIAKEKQYDCYALSILYGQKHSKELDAAVTLAKDFAVKEHKILNLPLQELLPCALTSSDINVPDYTNNNEIPSTYVPARNTIMLSIALGWAEVLNANTIFIGVSSVDYSGYPDCRPEYIESFRELAKLATKTGINGQSIKIATPLLYLSKAKTIQIGSKLGVDYKKTISCYKANELGQACNTCDSCHLRKQGFQEAGITDPTIYANP